MPLIDNEKFYTSAIELHGISPRGVNWASKENQLLRFKAILTLLPQNISEITISDAGCGFGDFYTYLKIKPKKYIGIDSLVDMYSIASKETGCEIIMADVCKDLLPETDYYICSGALNTLTKFETYQFIQNCFKSSKKGFIFNVLHGDKKSQTYNYLTTEDIEKIAKDLDVDRVKFKSEYLQNDITVGFFK